MKGAHKRGLPIVDRYETRGYNFPDIASFELALDRLVYNLNELAEDEEGLVEGTI